MSTAVADIVKKLEALPESKRLEVVHLIDSFASAASSKAVPGLYDRIVERADRIAATFGAFPDAVAEVRELRDERR